MLVIDGNVAILLDASPVQQRRKATGRDWWISTTPAPTLPEQTPHRMCRETERGGEGERDM